MDIVSEFKTVRRTGTPIIAIQTPDPGATILRLNQCLIKREKTGDDDFDYGFASAVWDSVRGLNPANEIGGVVIDDIRDGGDPEAFIGSQGIVEALMAIENSPEGAVIYFMNAHLYIDDASVKQGIWNLRDVFKASLNTLVLLGPSFQLPPELERDVFVYDEALPTGDEAWEIIEEIYDAFGDKLNKGVIEKAQSLKAKITEAVSGLGAFTIEQAATLSMTPEGIDIEKLWQRKTQMIEQTKGLSVHKGKENLSMMAGNKNLVNFGERIVPNFKCIVFVDEIEKGMGGSGGSGMAGDSSGTSQDQLQVILTEMQDSGYKGMMLVGIPGVGKSFFAKCLGGSAGIPVIKFDLGAMKGSFVGESEAAIRGAFKVVQAISGGDALFIATSNNIGSLPPELKRRFKLGTFFFGPPGEIERKAAWSIYRERFDIGQAQTKPDDKGWTPAEIETCCEMASMLGVTLNEAAKYIVPVTVSGQAQVERLMDEAHMSYISADYEGWYKKEESTVDKVRQGKGPRRVSSLV